MKRRLRLRMTNSGGWLLEKRLRDRAVKESRCARERKNRIQVEVGPRPDLADVPPKMFSVRIAQRE